MLFSFLKNARIITYLLDKFKDTDILNLKDNFKQDIYYYCLKLNLINLIPIDYKINTDTFIYLCQENIDPEILSIVIQNQPDILNTFDNSYISTIYYLMKYKPEFYKNLLSTPSQQSNIPDFNPYKESININNETLIMLLLKNSDQNTTDLISWLINKKIINSNIILTAI